MSDPTLTSPPPAPQPTDSKSAFNQKAFSFFGWFAGFITEMRAFVPWMNQKRAEVAADKQATSQYRDQANEVRSAVIGSMAFKGPWSGLTGSLSTPATVFHDGQYWVLLQPLSNVTTQEPGQASEYWGALIAGAAPSVVLTASATAQPGLRYLLSAPSITLTLPASVQKGDYFGFVDCVGDGSCVVQFGAHKHRGREVGAMSFDIPFSAGVVIYHDAMKGFV